MHLIKPKTKPDKYEPSLFEGVIGAGRVWKLLLQNKKSGSEKDKRNNKTTAIQHRRLWCRKSAFPNCGLRAVEETPAVGRARHECHIPVATVGMYKKWTTVQSVTSEAGTLLTLINHWVKSMRGRGNIVRFVRMFQVLIVYFSLHEWDTNSITRRM